MHSNDRGERDRETVQLTRNQKRRVTAYDLHATLKHLADWPRMTEPSAQATSLFVDLPDGRGCNEARVPAKWCLDTAPECFDGARARTGWAAGANGVGIPVS